MEAHTVLKWFTIQSGNHRGLGVQHPIGCSLPGEPTRCPAGTPPLVRPICQQPLDTSRGAPSPLPALAVGAVSQAGLRVHLLSHQGEPCGEGLWDIFLMFIF